MEARRVAGDLLSPEEMLETLARMRAVLEEVGEPYPLRQPLPRRQKLGGLGGVGSPYTAACKGTSNERRPPPGWPSWRDGAAWCGEKGTSGDLRAPSPSTSKACALIARSWRRSPWRYPQTERSRCDTRPPGSIRSLPTCREFWKRRASAPWARAHLGRCSTVPPESRWRDDESLARRAGRGQEAAALSAKAHLVNVAGVAAPNRRGEQERKQASEGARAEVRRAARTFRHYGRMERVAYRRLRGGASALLRSSLEHPRSPLHAHSTGPCFACIEAPHRYIHAPRGYVNADVDLTSGGRARDRSPPQTWVNLWPTPLDQGWGESSWPWQRFLLM